ncbi:MAG: RNA methyltransferase [Deltaproteobacteria bacterium]|nr:RNA methyltransferase [Deltaproteobacteria bacterium]
MQRASIPTKAQLKRWAKLTAAKHRQQEGLFLAEGGKVVDELLRSGRPLDALLVLRERTERWEALLARTPAGAGVYQLSAREWSGLSQDKAPEGVMAVAVAPAPVDPEGLVEGQGPLLLLDQVNNPNNLGALLRTADWFGFRTVLIGAGSVEAAHPKVVRTSMGSLFHLTLIEGVDLGSLLPVLRDRFRVIGSDAGEGIHPHPCPAGTALLLGSESHGLSDELLAMTHERWRIPGGGNAESLSLPQAAAVMMYECVKPLVGGR